MAQLEQLAESLAITQVKKPGMFLIMLAILLAVTLPGIALLVSHVEPSLEKILPQQVKEVQTMNDMRSQFGADMMYVVAEATGPTFDVRDPDVIKYLDVLSSKLEDNDYILQVDTLSGIVKDMNKGVIPESNQEIRRLLALSPRTPMFMNHDYRFAIIQLRSDTGATAPVVKRTVEDVEDTIASLQKYNPGLTLTLTGFNTIDKATFEVIISDFIVITGYSFLFMLVFLFLYFRSWRKVVASVSVIMISVMATLGLTGYLGITITVVTMVAAAMIMALGISYGINVTYYYSLLRKKEGKEESLRTLNRHMIRALIGSSFTTSAGFLALLFGIIPAMKNLGIVLAMGIVVTLLVSVLFLPVILFLLDNEQDKQARTNKKSVPIISIHNQ